MPPNPNKRTQLMTHGSVIAVLMGVHSVAQATGIMPPDIGLWGLVIVWGLPLLLVLGLMSLLWLFRQQLNTHLFKPVMRFSQWAYHSSMFRQLLLYGVPYVLILLYALHEIKSDHIRFYGFLLVEVFAVYVVIFWIPLIAVRFLLSFRPPPGDDDQ